MAEEKTPIERIEEKVDDLVRCIRGYNDKPGLVAKMSGIETKQMVMWILITIILLSMGGLYAGVTR